MSDIEFRFRNLSKGVIMRIIGIILSGGMLLANIAFGLAEVPTFPEIMFQQSYAKTETSSAIFRTMIPTSDSGYLLAGSSSMILTNWDTYSEVFWFVKIDKDLTFRSAILGSHLDI